MELKFADPKSASFSRSASYKFEQAGEDFVTADTTLMDPLDHRNVFIGTSGMLQDVLLLLFDEMHQFVRNMKHQNNFFSGISKEAP